MREIKFRVFYEPSNKTYDVLAIDFMKRNVTIEYKKGKSQVVSLDFCELMQYTGLKDRNGVEIYEGDIIKKTGDIKTYSIVFDGVLAAYFMYDGTGGYRLNQMLLRDFKIYRQHLRKLRAVK